MTALTIAFGDREAATHGNALRNGLDAFLGTVQLAEPDSRFSSLGKTWKERDAGHVKWLIAAVSSACRL